MLAQAFEWAAPHRSDRWCIRRAGGKRMLCGAVFNGVRKPGFCPTVQPDKPSPVHDDCWERYRRLVGVCPVCGGEAQVRAGRIGAHGEWVVGVAGVEIGERACAGAGMEPEV